MVSFRLRLLYLGNRWTGGWVGPRSILDAVAKRGSPIAVTRKETGISLPTEGTTRLGTTKTTKETPDNCDNDYGEDVFVKSLLTHVLTSHIGILSCFRYTFLVAFISCVCHSFLLTSLVHCL